MAKVTNGSTIEDLIFSIGSTLTVEAVVCRKTGVLNSNFVLCLLMDQTSK